MSKTSLQMTRKREIEQSVGHLGKLLAHYHRYTAQQQGYTLDLDEITGAFNGLMATLLMMSRRIDDLEDAMRTVVELAEPLMMGAYYPVPVTDDYGKLLDRISDLAERLKKGAQP